MKLARLVFAVMALCLVLAVGIIPQVSAQSTYVSCNCVVFLVGGSFYYGVKTPGGPCFVQSCYLN